MFTIPLTCPARPAPFRRRASRITIPHLDLALSSSRFFTFPEYFLYGGVAFAVAAISAICVLAFANRSMVWTRAMLFVWPFLLILSMIRCILMIVQLNRTKDKIQVSHVIHIASLFPHNELTFRLFATARQWECDNGGQMWTQEAFDGLAGTTGTVSGMPAGMSLLFPVPVSYGGQV